MLTVKKYKEKTYESIEFDIYTPINIEFGTWNISKEPTLYWRTGDFKKSLIEIGIGSDTGVLRSITLTLSENVLKTENNEHLVTNHVEVAEGTPVFWVDEYANETYIDEKGKLNVYIGKDNIYISFSESEIISLIKNNTILFSMDGNNQFCGILINGVGTNDKELLEKALSI
ncbi:hypothetical protein ABRT01_11975 [Lentibacillus sp. L22]|uniref:hypothetical protein n=1 Tax=Lentibacillus TaxID=175304 RepID=UPI0022B085D7|nr:hypothetical protein [Lentibacillus daqui]